MENTKLFFNSPIFASNLAFQSQALLKLLGTSVALPLEFTTLLQHLNLKYLSFRGRLLIFTIQKD